MSLATSLSVNDQSVLLTILSGGEGAAINHTNNNDSNKIGKRKIIVDVEMTPDRNVKEIDDLVNLEKRAILLIEKDQNYQEASDIFNEIISKEPLYASVYNNRAQLKRIIMTANNEDKDKKSKFNDIIDDLEKAVDLAEPAKPTDSLTEIDSIRVSKMQATLLQSAYTQLGATYLSMSNMDQYSNERWQLEEKASQAFFYAGEYGSEVAKTLASKVNPYAKLCGNMVQEALARERAL